ncbi:MAG: hypothetical protein ACLFPR_05470 [Desulfococcaceae bacterium]
MKAPAAEGVGRGRFHFWPKVLPKLFGLLVGNYPFSPLSRADPPNFTFGFQLFQMKFNPVLRDVPDSQRHFPSTRRRFFPKDGQNFPGSLGGNTRIARGLRLSGGKRKRRPQHPSVIPDVDVKPAAPAFAKPQVLRRHSSRQDFLHPVVWFSLMESLLVVLFADSLSRFMNQRAGQADQFLAKFGSFHLHCGKTLRRNNSAKNRVLDILGIGAALDWEIRPSACHWTTAAVLT